MSTLLEQVKAQLERRELHFEVQGEDEDERETIVHVPFSLSRTCRYEVWLSLRIEPQPNMLIAEARPLRIVDNGRLRPVHVPLEKCKAAAFSLIEMNWRLHAGAWKIDTSDGELKFERSEWLEDGQLAENQAISLIGVVLKEVFATLLMVLHAAGEDLEEESSDAAGATGHEPASRAIN